VSAYRFEVVVSLKEGLLDPQGKAVADALPSLGWSNVRDVRVGKHVDLTVEADDEESARAQLEEMAHRFLSNPVIEDVRIVDVSEVPAR
jgi:phosphoribosylformylglycinamidine synthase PurS subunit